MIDLHSHSLLSDGALVPADFLTREMAEVVAFGAGLSNKRYLQIRKDMAALL